jgi:hypothetical protein
VEQSLIAAVLALDKTGHFGHYAPVARPSRRTAIIASVVILAVASFVVGWALRGALQAEETYDGRMVYGVVSEVRDGTNTVCIEAKLTTCARLLTGTMPLVNTSVRGWLVSVPSSDDSASAPIDYWAFVTTVAG